MRAGEEPDFDIVRAAGALGPSDGLQVLDADGNEVFNDDLTMVGQPLTASRVAVDGTRFIVRTADPLDENFRDQLNVLMVLALGAIVAAAGLAAVQARQLAKPLERLATRASRIGEGDFSLQPYYRTRIPEIDDIGSALDTSAHRVDTMLANERHFTADATHQLRTGIAGIAMRLEILTMSADEGVAAEATAGLAQTDQLNATIDDLLAAARNRTTSERTVFDLTNLVIAHVEEWRPRFNNYVGTSRSSPPTLRRPYTAPPGSPVR